MRELKSKKRPDEEGKSEQPQNKEVHTKKPPKLIQNSQYLSIREAAKVLGVSQRSVYGYIASGKLPGERIGQNIVVRRETLVTYQRPAVGRPRSRTPIWRVPVETNLQYLLSISMCLRSGQEQQFQQKLTEIRLQRKHLIPGTVARYISRTRSLPEEIQIVLVWRQRLMPPEEERQAALAALRADFSDILEWETATSFEGVAALNT
ncbi:MAG TPA: helix-turn-helix domain-containing protein [Ktedonobacteraceae bacterium]|nr:helix-turn-helix domain-containing protein [Ktedonobacteraceae bacterium]